eukprot:SAG22_NODE_4885_length_1141_cov_1.379079_1_plen_328_part_10
MYPFGVGGSTFGMDGLSGGADEPAGSSHLTSQIKKRPLSLRDDSAELTADGSDFSASDSDGTVSPFSQTSEEHDADRRAVLTRRQSKKKLKKQNDEDGRCPSIGIAANLSKTRLFVAAAFGKADAIRLMLALGNPVAGGINEPDEYGMTPLHAAAQDGHREAVAALLQAGASMFQRDNDGLRSLDVAIKYGLTETLEQMLVHQLKDWVRVATALGLEPDHELWRGDVSGTPCAICFADPGSSDVSGRTRCATVFSKCWHLFCADCISGRDPGSLLGRDLRTVKCPVCMTGLDDVLALTEVVTTLEAAELRAAALANRERRHHQPELLY